MTKLPDYKVGWEMGVGGPLYSTAVAAPSPQTSGLTLPAPPQPYPMYPATTSLVNVVPKLNATGRDLLQVTEGKGRGWGPQTFVGERLGGGGHRRLTQPEPAAPFFRAFRTS